MTNFRCTGVAAALVALFALQGCGGGGGGSAGTSASAPEIATETLASSGTATTSTDTSTTSAAAAPAPAATQAPASSVLSTVNFADCPMFPADNIFNTRIDDTSRFPAHASTNDWVNMVGGSTPFLANWGWTNNPADGGYYGLPVNTVDGTSSTTNWAPVAFDFNGSGQSTDVGYPDKSDCAAVSGDGFAIAHDCASQSSGNKRFPFPANGTLVEGGTCAGPSSCGDHHVLVVEKGACRLWESFFTFQIGGQWYSMATAAWDLNSNAMRPDNWASADAAGLPITPLLAKASEASTGEIRHALRVTFHDSMLSLQHNWPARYAAGADNPGAIPFGSVLRLKADFQIPDSWSTQAKAVATAAKRYGLYVADNGENFYVQGEPSAGWSNATYDELKGIRMSDMEFVDLSSITKDARFSNDSYKASW